ncbi:YcxB family protein [Exiguobacterium acetylicum]|uniref:YcxB family protein n=1 Tax=Exiguobacterium acetylicum TaxID=41170 RepID=UPI0034D7B48B
MAYQMTLEDFMALQKDSIQHSKYHIKRQRRSIVVMDMMVFCCGFVFTSYWLPQIMSVVLFLFIAVVGGSLHALLLFPFIKKVYLTITLWQLRYFLKSDERFPRNVILNIDEKGIKINSIQDQVTNQLQIEWKSIDKVSEDDDHYFLYFEENEAIIIPKQIHDLNKTEQIKLRHLLQTYLKNII